MKVRGLGVLVTGASRGLGAALAAELGRRGARVVLVARGREELERAAKAVEDAGGEAHVVVGDVGDGQDAHRIAGAAAALVGSIDVLVHNASDLGPVPLALLLDTDARVIERVLAVNLVGPFLLSKALVGPMILKRRGLVVHVSSDAAVQPYARWGAYGVSKAGLDHLGRILAVELEGTGVRVLNVDPGEMDTQMHADAMPDADRSALARPEDVARRLADVIERSGDVATGSRIELASTEAA